MPKSLGGFLSFLQENYGEELKTVSKLVRPAHYEVTGLLENLNQNKQFPAVLFNQTENVHNQPSGIKVVSNIFAKRERCALALDMNPSECHMPLSLEYARREKLSVPPEMAEGPIPVQEVVITGEAVDVATLPIVRHYEMDMGPVITMTCCMRDPETGSYDVSFIKNFYKGKPDYMGVSIHSPHLERIVERYAKLGQPAPIITIIGHHPAFYLGALALSNFEKNDYELIGAFLGEPLRLAPSVTWGQDFLVPADAEIIIEGELLPGVREIVDPFGEVTRNYQAQCLRQAMQVKAITRRKEAIMQDIFSGHHGHWNLGGIPKEGSIFNSLQSKIGNIGAVHMPLSGVARQACYVSIRKTNDAQAKQTAVMALTETAAIQVVVVVDDDIDVFNEQDVIWAVLNRVDPKRDVSYIGNGGYTVFTTEMGHDKIIIDATKPTHKPTSEMFRVPAQALQTMVPEKWID